MTDTVGKTVAPATAGGGQPPKLKRKAGGRLECELGLVLGALGLAASRLGQLWIAFDVFSQFTLQFAVVALGFLAGRVMRRARLLVAFVCIVLGFVGIGAWPIVASDHPRALDVAAEGGRALTVASFNTFYDNPNTAAVQAEIERLDADIITLIELGPNTRGLLTALEGRYPYHADCFATDYCNMAVLSKLPIASSEARVGWDGPPTLIATLGPEAGDLMVFGVHTIRFPHAKTQFRQVNALAQFISTIPNRKLVMGDFNATPFSRITSAIVAQTGLQRLTNLPTWPARLQLPQVAIDHIFVSPGVRQLETEKIGNPAGSDHFPITLKLAVPLN